MVGGAVVDCDWVVDGPGNGGLVSVVRSGTVVDVDDVLVVDDGVELELDEVVVVSRG